MGEREIPTTEAGMGRQCPVIVFRGNGHRIGPGRAGVRQQDQIGAIIEAARLVGLPPVLHEHPENAGLLVSRIDTL